MSPQHRTENIASKSNGINFKLQGFDKKNMSRKNTVFTLPPCGDYS